MTTRKHSHEEEEEEEDTEKHQRREHSFAGGREGQAYFVLGPYKCSLRYTGRPDSILAYTNKRASTTITPKHPQKRYRTEKHQAKKNDSLVIVRNVTSPLLIFLQSSDPVVHNTTNLTKGTSAGGGRL